MASGILGALGSAFSKAAPALGSAAGAMLGAPSGFGGLGSAVGGMAGLGSAALPTVSYLGQTASSALGNLANLPSVTQGPYQPQQPAQRSSSASASGAGGWVSPFLPETPHGASGGGGGGSWGTRQSWTFGGYDPEAARRKAEQSQLVGQWNKAFARARQENLKRYNQMLAIANKTTGQRATDIRGDYANLAANERQRQMRLGMANAPVLPTLMSGVEREKQSALNRLADEMQGTKLGIIGARTDRAPDLASLLALSQAGGFGGLRF